MEKRKRMMCVLCLFVVNDEDLEYFFLIIIIIRIMFVMNVVINKKSFVNV